MADGSDEKKVAPEDEGGLPDFIDTDDAGAAEEVTQAVDAAADAAALPGFIEDDGPGADEEGDADAEAGEVVASLEEPPEPVAAEPRKGKDKKKAKAAAKAAPAAPVKAKAAARAEPAGEPLARIQPHSEGLFHTRPLDEAERAAIQLDEPFASRPRSRIALGIIAGTLVLVIGILAVLMGSEERRLEVQAFLEGTIEEHKTAEVKKLQAQWRDEDLKATNRYGDVTLTYFPADAKVTVTQVTFHQGGDAWRKNEATRQTVGEKVLENDTTKLKEGQTIERLPLLNLPIFEATKDEASGSVSDVYSYEYKVVFDREGYHPREFTWRPEDWQRVGPGNFIMEWSGLDLVPKPETVKANFAKAMGEVHCLMKLKKIATLQEATANENFEMLLLRNGFKTLEDFQRAYDALTVGEHEAWWKEQQEAIAKQECTE